MIMNLSGTLSRLKADMQEIAKLSADRIRQELTVSETIVSELGCSYQLSAAVFTPAQKQEYINQRVEAYGMVRGKLIGSNGICAADGTDYNDREYFKRSMQGEVVVSDPVIAKTDGKLSVIISAPVYEGGDKDGEIIGVVFVVPDPEFLMIFAQPFLSVSIPDATCWGLRVLRSHIVIPPLPRSRKIILNCHRQTAH